MAVKRTYSVRLEDDQRRQMEARATHIGLPMGHLIRLAIDDFLRQQEEKDYLSEVQAQIMTGITRLARQVEKDRAEQQLIMAFLDHLHDWLAFALPSPGDRDVAEQLRLDRRDSFWRDMPSKLLSKSRAKATQILDEEHAGPIFALLAALGICAPSLISVAGSFGTAATGMRHPFSVVRRSQTIWAGHLLPMVRLNE